MITKKQNFQSAWKKNKTANLPKQLLSDNGKALS